MKLKELNREKFDTGRYYILDFKIIIWNSMKFI
jgi:hypothetical protein